MEEARREHRRFRNSDVTGWGRDGVLKAMDGSVYCLWGSAEGGRGERRRHFREGGDSEWCSGLEAIYLRRGVAELRTALQGVGSGLRDLVLLIDKLRDWGKDVGAGARG